MRVSVIRHGDFLFFAVQCPESSVGIKHGVDVDHGGREGGPEV